MNDTQQPTSLAQVVRQHLAQQGITAVNVVGRDDDSVVISPTSAVLTSRQILTALLNADIDCGEIEHQPSADRVVVWP
ncbi:hypothetical protein ACFXGA_06360 [Actinosynnema sp. NPDC059335]|uniref:hypothetical protein n=1 Tax=Actinosynnema sp. NPDC059335 TaxID=3346804 RepID=UPI00367070D6